MKKVFLIMTIFVIYSMNICAENIIKNGDFSMTTNDLPDNWTVDSYNQDNQTIFSVNENTLKILSKNINHSYAVQEVLVTPGKKYKFSAKIKTEEVGEEGNGALISLYYMIAYSEEVKGTTQGFNEVELYFSSDTKNVPIMLSLGGYGKMNKGAAYFKDVQITEVSDVPEGAKYYHKKADEKNISKSSSSNKEFDNSWIFLSVFLFLVISGSLYYIYKK